MVERTTPNALGPGERKALAELLERAAQWSLFCACNPTMDAKKILDLHFKSDGGYGGRWPLRTLLFVDAKEPLDEVLKARFPVEAPIGFHHGSLLAEAALIGAPGCVSLLIAAGAKIDSPNEGGDLPIELAAMEAASSGKGLECLEVLAAAGAAASRAARQKAKRMLFSDGTPVASGLGRIMLNQARLDWHDIPPSSMPSRQSSELAARLDRMLSVVGARGEEAFGPGASDCAEACGQMGLPSSIAEAMLALEEARQLSALGLGGGSCSERPGASL